jgi:aspartyl-tRNA(Asn)/glutamyl-tRNA(Gln) amidotransferase subunit A
LILQVIAGKDERDATATIRNVDQYVSEKTRGIKNLRVGFCQDYFAEGMSEEIRETTQKALRVFEKAGAKIKEVKLLSPKYTMAVYTIIQRAEVSSNLARYDGTRYGTGREDFGDEAKRRIMFGTYTLSAGYYDQYYLKAQKVRRLIIEDFRKAFKKIDILVAPTTPVTALPVGATKNEPLFGEIQDILTEPSSLAGLPAVSLPAGFDRQGLPIGVQMIGPQFSEALLLEAAFFWEQVTKYYQQKPKL